MRVTLKNQHDTNIAEALVVVGCGLDGAENNEPSFQYVINADGLTICRDTDDGSVIGHVHLTNGDLDRLCQVPGACETPHEGAVLYQGDDATEMLKELLDVTSDAGTTGRIWVLGSRREAWTELGVCPLDTALAAQTVLIKYTTKEGEAFKYTYYPPSKVGLLLREP